MKSILSFFATPKKTTAVEVPIPSTSSHEDATGLENKNNHTNSTSLNSKPTNKLIKPVKPNSSKEYFEVVIPITGTPKKRSRKELAIERQKVISSNSDLITTTDGPSSRTRIATVAHGFSALEAKTKAESAQRKADRLAKGKGVPSKRVVKKKVEVEPIKKKQRMNLPSASPSVTDEDGDVGMEKNEDEDEEEDEEEDEDEDEDEEEEGLVSKETQQELASDEFSKAFSTMQTATTSLRIGEIISLDTKGEDAVWLGRLMQIRGRKADISEATDKEGNLIYNNKGQIRESCEKTYLQVRWLYDRNEFTVIPQDARWSAGRTQPMGLRERVLTSHLEWKEDGQVLSSDAKANYTPNTFVFLFDDSIPYDEPSHPLTVITHRKAVAERNPPLIYFGDDDYEQHSYHVGSHYLRNELYLTRLTASTELPFVPLRAGRPATSLTFNLHSMSKKPYNPVNVQIFSPYADRWFSTADLLEKKCYKDEDEIEDEDDEEEEEEEDEDDAIPSGSRQISVKASTKKPSSSKSSTKSKSKPKKFLPLVNGSRKLKILAKSTIMRGGAYGLIGNEWIVKESRAISQGSCQWTLEYEEQLFDAEATWTHRVKARGRDNGGKGRNKVVGKPLGLPPTGMKWTCPIVGKFI